MMKKILKKMLFFKEKPLFIVRNNVHIDAFLQRELFKDYQ